MRYAIHENKSQIVKNIGHFVGKIDDCVCVTIIIIIVQHFMKLFDVDFDYYLKCINGKPSDIGAIDAIKAFMIQ